MSELWNVTVEEVGPDWVDLEVVLAHPDANPFPEDRVFALCLLTGEAYALESMTNWVPNCPLGEAIPREQSYQPFDVAPRVDEFVTRVLIYKAYKLPWNGDWGKYWKDKNNLPRAMYRISVTDPKWLQHLSPGMAFDSAAYSETGPWVNENRMMSAD